ncbi:interleukin-8-like [Pseudophryne corroboree]|uniref:interleukin-8-like n=1 Tax=Pseudophryne corroboree TaxID=495146 RepID=UPI0030816399
MQSRVHILPFLAVCLTFIALSEEMTLTRARELRCQCVKTESRPISHRHFLNIELIPKGPHCKHLEVIGTLKNGQEICLEPTAPWVKKLIDKYLTEPKTTVSPK